MKCDSCGIESNQFLTEEKFKSFGAHFFCPQCFEMELSKVQSSDSISIKQESTIVHASPKAKLNITPSIVKQKEPHSQLIPHHLPHFEKHGLHDENSIYIAYERYVFMKSWINAVKSATVVSAGGGLLGMMASSTGMAAFNKFDYGIMCLKSDGLYMIGNKPGAFKTKFQEIPYFIPFKEISTIQVKRKSRDADIYTFNLVNGNNHKLILSKYPYTFEYFHELLDLNNIKLLNT